MLYLYLLFFDYLLVMKQLIYHDNYYQIPMITFNSNTGKGQYERINVLGKSFDDTVRRARLVNNNHQFENFAFNYKYLKIALIKDHPMLKGYEISRCHAEACLRIFNKDNRTDDDINLMILTEARNVIKHYLQNKNSK